MHIQISNVRKTIHQAVFGKKNTKKYQTTLWTREIQGGSSTKKHLNFLKIPTFFLKWIKMYQFAVSELHLHLNVHPGFVTISFLDSLALDFSVYR